MTRCPDCVARGHSIWLEDAEGVPLDPPQRCTNPTHPWNSTDAPALVALAATHPKALEAAKAIIRDYLEANDTVDANVVRPWMEIAQIPEPLIGVAFGQMSKAGELVEVDRVRSTKSNTNGHKVGVYRRQEVAA